MFATHSQFYKPKETEQKPNQVVDITGWAIGGSFAHYPDGSRAKFEVFCPSITSCPFLISRHRYLYKKTFERKSGVIFFEQYWVEIIAYKLGRILNIGVPPAFVARYTDPVRGLEYASLIEWYYNYPEEKEAEVTRGGDLMSLLINNYDREKGAQHNFESIMAITVPNEDWKRRWAEMLLFDAIIGNTDRHQENWEIVIGNQNAGSLSPAFDNGTAMGYEILNDDFSKRLANLEAYVSKGTHHMKWALADDKKAGHFELLQKLVDKFPETKAILKEKLAIDISGISDDIAQLTEFQIDDPRYRLTKERAEFIKKLLFYRYAKIRQMFDL